MQTCSAQTRSTDKTTKPWCFNDVWRSMMPTRKPGWQVRFLWNRSQSSIRCVKDKKRKCALIVDNCPTHPKVKGLKNVTLYFLPPNKTSKTQPMDKSVFWKLNHHYRKKSSDITSPTLKDRDGEGHRSRHHALPTTNMEQHDWSYHHQLLQENWLPGFLMMLISPTYRPRSTTTFWTSIPSKTGWR